MVLLMKSSDKAQVLIMTAIVMVLVAIAIRIEFDSVSSIDAFEFERSSTAPELFLNLRDEFANSARLAFIEDHDGAYADSRLANYTRFVRSRENIEVVYSVAAYAPPSTFTVRVRNFLDEDLANVRVSHNLTGVVSTVTIGDLAIGASGTATTSSSLTDEKVVQVNVSYTGKARGKDLTHIYLAKAGPVLNYSTVYASLSFTPEQSTFSDVVRLTLSYNTSSGGGGGGGGGGSCEGPDCPQQE